MSSCPGFYPLGHMCTERRDATAKASMPAFLWPLLLLLTCSAPPARSPDMHTSVESPCTPAPGTFCLDHMWTQVKFSNDVPGMTMSGCSHSSCLGVCVCLCACGSRYAIYMCVCMCVSVWGLSFFSAMLSRWPGPGYPIMPILQAHEIWQEFGHKLRKPKPQGVYFFPGVEGMHVKG